MYRKYLDTEKFSLTNTSKTPDLAPVKDKKYLLSYYQFLKFRHSVLAFRDYVIYSKTIVWHILPKAISFQGRYTNGILYKYKIQ